MATISYPQEAYAPARIDLDLWRPGEASHQNLVGDWDSLQRGRERFRGTVRWDRTHREVPGSALESFLGAMDDPRNTAEIPLRRPTFRYAAGHTELTVVSAIGSAAILSRFFPGMRNGCFVECPRLLQVLVMHNFLRTGDPADASLVNNVSVRFAPAVNLLDGEVLLPATTIRIRRDPTGKLILPNAAIGSGSSEWGPWACRFVEDVVP